MTREETNTFRKKGKISFFLLTALTLIIPKKSLCLRERRHQPDYSKMSLRERQEYEKNLDSELENLMGEMNEINDGMEADYGGKLETLKPKLDSNMEANYFDIFKYIKEKEAKDRGEDFIMCGLKLMLDSKKSKYYEDLVYKILTNYRNEIKNSNGKKPFKICEIQFRELSVLKKIFGLFFEPVRILKGKDSLSLMSKLLVYLANERNVFLYKSIFTLHTLSNLFYLDLNLDFYYMENQITKHYGKKKMGAFFNQVVNNQISKCSYSKNFKKKVGFSYSNLYVVEMLMNQHDEVTALSKVSDAEKEADKIIENHQSGNLYDLGDVPETYKGVKKFSFEEKRGNNRVRIIEDKGILRDYYWHLNYPIPVETEYTHKRKSKMCLKCKNSIILIAQNLGSVVAEFQDFMDIEKSSYIITEKTAFFDNKKMNEGSGSNQSDYFALLEQMAGRGDNEATLELAQDHYYGNERNGIPRNEERANQYYEEAAARGDHWAIANLALMKMSSKKYLKNFRLEK